MWEHYLIGFRGVEFYRSFPIPSVSPLVAEAEMVNPEDDGVSFSHCVGDDIKSLSLSFSQRVGVDVKRWSVSCMLEYRYIWFLVGSNVFVFEWECF